MKRLYRLGNWLVERSAGPVGGADLGELVSIRVAIRISPCQPGLRLPYPYSTSNSSNSTGITMLPATRNMAF